ncbi:GTP-binding protein [Methanocella paludicola SANAE]|uniref:GTP-binding protein n=1 Tax=Methanocella paludicola (strain DSM 17711 / JCM 13418 / NBRC 101707 / SANAE) TaxID=304371 RepID=D1Z169_METPS|nr:redox-regulated ATPase YchF [Methanocella paludicola]BAI62441.1 GTP-binding protein [Methanocella paludicola SANAE]
MSILIALAGKPNCGKSTFFKAATLADVEIANYPFTTIKPNLGVSYVRAKCPCKELHLTCPKCSDGERFIAVELLDVAGLVPEAHKGKGLGNAFLDDMRQAQAIIHVIDASGGTDIEGNVVPVGTHDPLDDIKFLETEITMWMFGILHKNWVKLSRKASASGEKIEDVIAEQFAGLGIDNVMAKQALLETGLVDKHIVNWTEPEMIELSDLLRKISKPLVIAANKADIAPPQNLEKLKGLEKDGYRVIACSAGIELALRNAASHGFIQYLPGDKDFTIKNPEKLNPAQKGALEKMREFLKKNDGTGIQKCLNEVVFGLLGYIVAYPVEDESKFTDKSGNVLPDAFLIKKGSTARDLAFRVHTQIGESFLFGINARTKMRLGDKYELQDNDIIKITSTK